MATNNRYPRTPPLSLEGSREVLEELSRGPADTPERRRTMERVRALEEQLRPQEIEEPAAKVRGLTAEDQV